MKYFVLIPIFISCSMGPDTQDTNSKQLENVIDTSEMVVVENTAGCEFLDFVDETLVLQVGYKKRSSESFPNGKVSCIQFIPEGATLIGRMESNNSTHYFIYTYPGDIRIPILETYDSTGKKINEVNLFDYKFCSDFPEIGDNICEFEIIAPNKLIKRNILIIGDEEKIVYQDTLSIW